MIKTQCACIVDGWHDVLKMTTYVIYREQNGQQKNRLPATSGNFDEDQWTMMICFMCCASKSNIANKIYSATKPAPLKTGFL